MIPSLLRTLRAASLVLALLPAGAALAAPDERVPVDVELVLAVDISYSMDFDELALQRDGYVLGITSPQFVEAVAKGPHGRIAVTYVEWAGASEQRIVIPWQVIDGPAAAENFAQQLKDAPLRRAYRTSISGAIKFSAALFGTTYKGIRRVIDVSGDGTNNQGELVEPVRDEAVKKGITINGLPVMLKAPVGSMIDIPELDVYYEDCVIGGPGAFIVPVRERPQFADAIRNKLILEVAGLTPKRNPYLTESAVVPAASPPRTSCTIGEQMWQQRWGGGYQ